MSIQNILRNFSQNNQSQNTQAQIQSNGDQASPLSALTEMVPGGLAGGAVAGGVMALLLGSKSSRKMAKKVAKFGGTAVLGGLAYKAYSNWQQNKALGQTSAVSKQDIETAQLTEPAYFQSEQLGDSNPFAMTLIKTMIAAAKSDGNIDSQEHARLFSSIEKLDLTPQSKIQLFDLLARDISIEDIVSKVGSEEEKAEVYLAAYLAIEVDNQSERTFLNRLAAGLGLPKGFPAYLEEQADQGIEAQ